MKRIVFIFGGERGIRTPEKLAPLIDFESTAFDHSAISPLLANRIRILLYACLQKIQYLLFWKIFQDLQALF